MCMTMFYGGVDVCAGDVDVDSIICQLPSKEKLGKFKMIPADFEKVRHMISTHCHMSSFPGYIY